MSGAASLSVDAVLGLRLSDTIASVLANFSGWPSNPGWWTALILILLMSAGQIVSMKLPQWLQKSRMDKVTKLGKSPAETSSQKQMKWVSWIMTIFIIIMGFTLPAAMGVYWFAGALFSIMQTLILHFVMNRKTKEKNNMKKYSAKTLDEAIKIACTDLDINTEDLIYEVEEEKKVYLKSSNFSL